MGEARWKVQTPPMPILPCLCRCSSLQARWLPCIPGLTSSAASVTTTSRSPGCQTGTCCAMCGGGTRLAMAGTPGSAYASWAAIRHCCHSCWPSLWPLSYIRPLPCTLLLMLGYRLYTMAITLLTEQASCTSSDRSGKSLTPVFHNCIQAWFCSEETENSQTTCCPNSFICLSSIMLCTHHSSGTESWSCLVLFLFLFLLRSI